MYENDYSFAGGHSDSPDVLLFGFTGNTGTFKKLTPKQKTAPSDIF